MIGSPAGMKTLVVAGDGERWIRVGDLSEAVQERGVHSASVQEHGADWKKTLTELAEAAPNLDFNVKNATARPRVLWIWATVGIILQATALVIPGLATYF
jgi:hypothetical protein